MNANTVPVAAPDLSRFAPRFLAGLARRVEELSALAAALDDREKLDATMRLFHSIAGLAGTFGFHHLTTVSRGAEILCARSLDSGVRLSVEERLTLLEAIMHLRNAATTGLQQAA
jgi:chemotaxis protein histidine kinase CheA